MSAIPTNLNQILKISREYAAQNMRTLAVFDLDSTLFNVSTRTQKILSEFAEKHQIERLKGVQVKHEDWGIKEAVLRAGFSMEHDIEILKELRDFWSERFFTSEYLHYDVPYLGAISFVQDLADTGCEIKYLTGRDNSRMRKGTVEVLEKWGFPFTSENLFLKPNNSQEDELYKHEWFKELNHSDYKKIFFFENEPVNVNAIIDSCPEVEIIFLDTTHARKQEVSAELCRIKHFGRD
ncbi:MAG: HAD family acid phosphatase [Pseudobdellovibrio sp.]